MLRRPLPFFSPSLPRDARLPAMKARQPEAARLEADYLDRLAVLLAGREADEATDIYLDAKARIESLLEAGPGSDVTLVRMAMALERLGPPEAFVAGARGARDALPPPLPAGEVPTAGADSLPLRAGADIDASAPTDPPAPGLSGLVARYFAGTRRYSRGRFILEMACLAFPLKALLGALWAMVGGDLGPSTTEAIDRGDGFSLLVTACLVAPLLETVLGQWLPLGIASWFTKQTVGRVAFSAVAFSALHLHVGFAGFLTALPPGILLAWSFALKRERSRWEAYWVTSAIHAVHNFIALFFYYAGK